MCGVCHILLLTVGLLLADSTLVANLCRLEKVSLILKLAPYMEGRERLKKESEHSRLVGGSFNKQGNFLTRLILGGCELSRSPHPLAKS